MSSKRRTWRTPAMIILTACVVCIIIVVSVYTVIKDQQMKDLQRHIVIASGLDSEKSLAEIFRHHIQTRLVDLRTGELVDEDRDTAAQYDQRAAALDPAASLRLTPEQDMAKIERRANLAVVYLLRGEQGELQRLILPIHGAGLWSTMYAFVGVDPDGRTIQSLVYYEHEETSGLGSKIESDQWRAQWVGKSLFNQQGQPAIRVLNNRHAATDSRYEIEGISGATFTGRGVQNTFTFWFGENGFRPFLQKVQARYQRG